MRNYARGAVCKVRKKEDGFISTPHKYTKSISHKMTPNRVASDPVEVLLEAQYKIARFTLPSMTTLRGREDMNGGI